MKKNSSRTLIKCDQVSVKYISNMSLVNLSSKPQIISKNEVLKTLKCEAYYNMDIAVPGGKIVGTFGGDLVGAGALAPES
jgi:hypothetical protein